MNTRPWASVLARLIFVAVVLTGCSPSSGSDPTDKTDDTELLPLRLGLQTTIAALPFWVAEERGLYEKAGLDIEIQNYPSAADRNAAFTANAADAVQGDPVSLALLEAQGFPVSATALLLGATGEEGRQGIVATPGSKAKTIGDLAGVEVGTSFSTHQEYVVDRLFAQAGVADLKKEEVKKVPIRYKLLMEGKLAACALPEPWLSLAESKGCTVIADDSTGENLSQEVVMASDEWLATEDGAEAMRRLLAVWDEAVAIINADPDSFRGTLVEKAGIPDELRDTFVIDTYPSAPSTYRGHDRPAGRRG